MIEINPNYEIIFSPINIDDNCDKIADLMKNEVIIIKEIMDAGLYRRAVLMYLQLLLSMCKHFVEDEHYCYFDDLYAPEYILQNIYEDLQMHDLGFDVAKILKEGHDIIMDSKCYREYGHPSYL